MPITVAPPCPPWCGLHTGHDATPQSCDPIDGTRYIRHRAVISDGLTVEQLVIASTDGAIDVLEPVVVEQGREHTLDQARRLAAALSSAVERAAAPRLVLVGGA